MKHLLIRPGIIKRADLTTLRAEANKLQAVMLTAKNRQEVYDTYVALIDEIASRKDEHPLLFKRSAVYTMLIDDIRDMADQLDSLSNRDAAQENTLQLLLAEMDRRKVQAKKTYDRRKRERRRCSTR